MVTRHTTYPGQPLTSREREVISCIAAGMSNATAGQHLGLSRLTIKSHLTRIGGKFGTGDRAGIVAAAIRSGQIELPGQVPVVCSCRTCAEQLTAGQGPAARISRMRLPERAG